MRNIVLCVILFCIQLRASAQSDKYLVFGLGFSITSIKDDGQSPLFYKCQSPTFKIGYESYSKKWIHKINVDFVYGGLKNKYSPGFYEEQPFIVLGHINYSVNRTSYQFGNEICFSPGVFIDVTANFRMIPKLENSMAAYEFFPNLGYSQMLQKNLKLRNSNFRVTHSLQIPLVTYLMRSNYVSMMNYIDPDASYLNTILSSGRLASVNKLLRVNSQFDLAYLLENDNQLKISYLWDYYNCNTINKSQTARNSIILSTLFNF